MAEVCPVCKGLQVGCPTCNAPPKHVIPKAMMSLEDPTLKFRAIPLATKTWEVQGIDISAWNGNINFAVTKTKCQYGIMRLGYGNSWQDSKSDIYYQGAQSNDFPMGAYWFCYIGQDYQKHAASFASELLTHRPQLDMVLDAETTTLDPTGTLNWLIALDKELTRLTGKQPIIYTAAWFWNTKVARSNYFSGRMNWVANWTTRDYPYTPTDLSLWEYWQWWADGNKKAAEYGSTGGDPDMDLNRSIHTVDQFNVKYSTHIKQIGVITPPIPPTPTPLPPYVIINTTNLGIHNTTQTGTANLVGFATINTKWYPYELIVANGAEWYRVGNSIYIDKHYTRYP